MKGKNPDDTQCYIRIAVRFVVIGMYLLQIKASEG
jgi:hypothetical protein